MISDFEKRVERRLESLRDHELVTVVEGEKVSAYYIRKPGTRIMSTLIVFTPEGIVLQGDHTPQQDGSVSTIGYGRNWFAGKLSCSYLCEKFLEHKWSPEVAAEELRNPEAWWREDATPEALTQLDELANAVEDGSADMREIYDTFVELGFETADGLPGGGYDSDEAVALAAIQRKFAQLWAKQNP